MGRLEALLTRSMECEDLIPGITAQASQVHALYQAWEACCRQAEELARRQDAEPETWEAFVTALADEGRAWSAYQLEVQRLQALQVGRARELIRMAAELIEELD